MIRIHRHARGPRVYVLGKRVHHGTVGVVGVCVFGFTGQKRMRSLSLLMLAHDARDFPFLDRNNH
jgi:hypothetical protein